MWPYDSRSMREASRTHDKVNSQRCEQLSRLNDTTACMIQNAAFLTDEIIDVLPMLLLLREGAGGVFLEIGASTGMDGSQTLALERCFAWHGLLVEAQPQTFAKLQASPRTSAKIWAAACPDGEHVHMTNESHQRAAYIKTASSKALVASVPVPCREIRGIMRSEGLSRLHFASVDVQGAELGVLQTMDFDAVDVLMVEAEGMDVNSQMRIQLVQTHLHQRGLMAVPLDLPSTPRFHNAYNELYVQPALANLSASRPSQVYARAVCAKHKLPVHCRAGYHHRPLAQRIHEALSVWKSLEIKAPCTD